MTDADADMTDAVERNIDRKKCPACRRLTGLIIHLRPDMRHTPGSSKIVQMNQTLAAA